MSSDYARWTIVAEMGSAHLGSLNLARDIVDACADAGIQEVKGQLRPRRKEWKKIPRIPGRGYGGTYYQHRAAIDGDAEFHAEVAGYAARGNIKYYVSAWSPEAAAEAVKIGNGIIKVPAALYDWDELYRAAGSAGATGFYVSLPHWVKMRSLRRDGVARIYHCITAYPTQSGLGNSFRRALDGGYPACPFGVSLHFRPSLLPVAAAVAASRGAVVFEFHIAPYTTTRRQTDARFAVSLDDLETVVAQMRTALRVAAGPPPNDAARTWYANTRMRYGVPRGA